MKKVKILLFALLLILVLMFSCNVNAATDATETTTTSTGKTVTWSYTLNSNDQIENLVCTNIESVTGVVDIPATLDGKTVISIGDKAFYQCTGITGVNFNSNITSIGDSAFAGCVGITSLDLSVANITSIGDSAFSGCVGIQSLNLGTKVTKISSEAFSDCSGIVTLTIPDSVTYLGDEAFYDCSGITSLTISKSVTRIPERCFGYCVALTEVIIPETVTTISGQYPYTGAFYKCEKLKKVLIPSTVVSISENAFANSPDLTIYGEEGSVAETYASENSIPFDLISNWDNSSSGNDITSPVIDKIKLENVSGNWNTTTSDYRIPSGLEIKFVVTFSEDIKGTQVPTLKIKIGDGENIELTEGTISGANIIYLYTVKDNDNGLITVVGVEGGNLTDEAGNTAELDLPEDLVNRGLLVSGFKVYVDNEKSGETTTPGQDEDEGQQGGDNNQGTDKDNEGTQGDTTTAPDTSLPQTGESVAVIATIIVVCGIMAVLFVKNRKYRDIK